MKIFLLFILVWMSYLSALERPNVVLILVDDMGYSDLGCWGSEIKTPHLDNLAKGGVRFTQMYNTAKCFTTRSELITGAYYESAPSFSNISIADVLKPSGYYSMWSGKHHNNKNPLTLGFDKFYGFLGGAINFWNPSRVVRDGDGTVAQMKRIKDYTWGIDGKEIKPFIPPEDWYATDAFTDRAIDWLDQVPDNSPFFLYLAYNSPHWPLHAKSEDISKYKGVYDSGYGEVRKERYEKMVEMGIFNKETTPLSPTSHEIWLSLSEEDRKLEAERMEVHAAMVDNVDQNVGRIIEKLKSLDCFENTLILFLSDNGGSPENVRGDGIEGDGGPLGTVGSYDSIGKSWANVINTPMFQWKGKPYEGGINTPMIAHWPAGIENQNRISHEAVHLVDFVPTMLEITHSEYPLSLEGKEVFPLSGRSFMRVLKDQEIKARKEALYFLYRGRAIREGNWKALKERQKNWELYDLATDKTETKNLAAKYPEKLASLSNQWESWYLKETGKKYDPDLKNKQKTKK